MTEREPIKVIADILIDELDLDAGQVMLGYQKTNILTAGLYVSLSYVSSKVIGVKSELVDVGLGAMKEYQYVSVQHAIQIDLMSYDGTARTRKMEVAMALSSFMAQRAQSDHNLQIAPFVSPFMDASEQEETRFFHRYITTVLVTALTEKSKSTKEYYDNFTEPEVHVNAEKDTQFGGVNPVADPF